MSSLVPVRSIYPTLFHYWANSLLFPLKQIIPQPVVSKFPFFTTNEDIRVGLVRNNVRGRLLDIGCGKNRVVREYRANGGVGLGVDVYDWGSVDLVVTNTAHLPYKDGEFDTITFVACLNHIPNRGEVLKEAVRLLAPGGRILLTNLGPFISWIWHKYAFWDDDQHERGMAAGEVYGFTENELQTLIHTAGLRVADRYRFSWGLNELLCCERR